MAWLVRACVAIDYEAHHPWADRPVIDEASYERWSLEIASGNWLGDEVFFQEPLYPYALGLFHALAGERDEAGAWTPNRTGARHAQALLGALGVGLVALVTRRLFGPWPALVAGALGALSLPWIHAAVLFLKPNLVLPLVALLTWLLWATREGRRGAWLALGVTAGLGALLRGNLLLLLPFFVVVPWLRAARGPRLRQSLVVLAGITLVLAPVAVRNLAVGGVFALSTSGAGTNLYGGNNEHNPSGRATEFPWVRGIPEHEADDWRHEAERRLGRAPLDRGEVSRFWMRETWRSIVARPGLHLAILARKLRLVLSPYETPDNHSLAWDRQHVRALRGPFVGWGFVGGLALAGLALSLRRERGATWELAAFLILYAATIVLTVVSGRIRLALLPLALPFAGYAVHALVVAWRARRPLVESSVVALGFAVVVLARVPAAERELDLAERDFNHAIYLAEAAEGEAEAEAVARDLAARYPGSSRVETLLAALESRRGFARLREGDEDAAKELLGRALARLQRVATADGVVPREVFRARGLAGTIQARLGRPEVAERHFAAALDFDPEDAELRLAWAEARLERVRSSAAEDHPALIAEFEAQLDAWGLEGATRRELDSRLVEATARR